MIDRLLVGPGVCHTARQRAKYSRYDWAAWTGRDGVGYAAPVSVASIRAAMLATGTQRTFIVYERRTGSGQVVFWWMANNIRRQLLRGV